MHGMEMSKMEQSCSWELRPKQGGMSIQMLILRDSIHPPSITHCQSNIGSSLRYFLPLAFSLSFSRTE